MGAEGAGLNGKRAVVIGAGIVGVCTALSLRAAGAEVTVLDPGEPGGRQSASYGNGAWFSPASVVPMSMPGLWRRVPGMLLDPRGPLTIRPGSLPRLAPWLLRFLYAGATIRRVEATARALRPLLEPAPELHEALAIDAGVERLVKRKGLIYAYPSAADFGAESLAWRLRRDNGVAWTELDADALRAAAPSLSHAYRFGVLVQAGAHCMDPGAYVAALASLAAARGVRFVRKRATGFRVEAGRLEGVLLEGGELPCDRAVICAGIASRALAMQVGDRPSLESERGYHVVVDAPALQFEIPVQPSDTRIGMTLTDAGLRGAGQVELADMEAPPDWRRAGILLEHLKRAFPALSPDLTIDQVDRWLGHRPSTPDGLPMIGPSSASPDVVFAFGHGHVGLASAPMTARIVAAILAGGVPGVPLAPYCAQRFNHWWPRPAANLHQPAPAGER